MAEIEIIGTVVNLNKQATQTKPSLDTANIEVVGTQADLKTKPQEVYPANYDGKGIEMVGGGTQIKQWKADPYRTDRVDGA